MVCSLLYVLIFALFSNHDTDFDWYDVASLNSAPPCNAMEEIKTKVGDGAAPGDRVTGAFVGTGAMVGDEVVGTGVVSVVVAGLTVVVVEVAGLPVVAVVVAGLTVVAVEVAGLPVVAVELAELTVVAGPDDSVDAKGAVGLVMDGAEVGPSDDPSGAADAVNGADPRPFVELPGTVDPLEVGVGTFACDGDGCLDCRIGELVGGVGGVEGGRVGGFVTNDEAVVPVPPFTPFLLLVDFVPKYTPKPAPPATKRNKQDTKRSTFRFLLIAC